MQEIVINCKGVTKIYGDGPTAVHALRGVDLEIKKGEIFMIVGPSGCGKTTLISIIASILNPSSGVCEVLSQDHAAMPEDEKIKFRAENIGFVFQAYNLLPALTSQENAAVPLLINNYSWEEAMKLSREMLEMVELKSKIKSLPANLSGGQQQRIAIARALVHKPKIIVCDEPTSALDHVTGEKIMTIMKDLTKKLGLTLVIVTHDNRIYKYADRIGTMDDGRIVKIEENK